MAKTSGLGDRFLIGGYDISGNINSIGKIETPVETLDVTDITQLGHARLTGRHSGGMSFMSYMSATGGVQDPPLATLPRTDTLATYCRGTTLGNPAACVNSKQINFDPKRDDKGNLTLSVDCASNAYGLEWGIQLTPGVFTSSNLLVGTASTFETGIANWALRTNCTVAQSNTVAHGGTYSLAVTSAASGDMVAGHCTAGNITTQGFACAPGQQTMVNTWVRSAASVRTVSTGVAYYTAGGSIISVVYGSGVSDAVGSWTHISGTVIAPATAAFGMGVVKVASTGAASEIHYIDDVQYVNMPGTIDNAASTAFGAQAYLHVPAFTGTDITVKVQHSTDLATWADLISFTQVTTAYAFERKYVSNVTTVNRYVQAIAVTTGGFTNAYWHVSFMRNPIAGVVF